MQTLLVEPKEVSNCKKQLVKIYHEISVYLSLTGTTYGNKLKPLFLGSNPWLENGQIFNKFKPLNI